MRGKERRLDADAEVVGLALTAEWAGHVASPSANYLLSTPIKPSGSAVLVVGSTSEGRNATSSATLCGAGANKDSRHPSLSGAENLR